ncbi:MAG: ATPase [Gammaproteobacteria bacterium RIFCSPHIGHO2_12_FULL_37_34]|nr:MAG: ATPase [Gammaproteobacteria bacterium RIFCSPHIGHO2_12_FULL_37_34]
MPYIQRLFEEPEDSYFLFGPRGVGKSTYLKLKHENDAIWIDLLKPDEYRSYFAKPERLHDLIIGSPKKSIIIVDEIQRAPNLLSVIHSIIEEKRNFKFILTGSSARKLKKTNADLLGGRALYCSLSTFMAAELGQIFSLEHALEFGLLPLLLDAKNPQQMLHAYVSLYLHEEIQAEGLVRNLENFSRFLEVVSFSHAATLNVTNVARECEVKRKTVENYIQILEDLLLAFQLPIFSKRAKRELSIHPKFYLFDAGVYNILRPQGPFDKTEEINGAALEGLVAQHLMAWIDYTIDKKYRLHFWRTRSGLEVDFIIYGPKYFWAIEVKNAKRIHPYDTRALKAFIEDYPQAKALLLYRGKEYVKQDNVLCIPCEDFLKQLKPNQDIWND